MVARQMVARKITCNNNAPVWAWHSCGKFENPPTLVDAKALLSDFDIEGGIQTIEFECPAELALLSSYGVWNMIIDEFLDSNEEAKIDRETEELLFKVNRRKFKRYDDIQAALPYLRLDWVTEIRELHLKPGDYNYNQYELV